MNVIKSFDGSPITYQVNGEGSPALILVHGWSCNHTSWSSQIQHFAKNHMIITLNLAGHGDSKSERTLWDMENYAKDVFAVYENLGINEVILIGHSMGGAVILEAGHLIGENVKGLIGVDSMVYPPYSKISKDQVDEMVQPFERDFDKSVKDMVSNLLPDDVDHDLYLQIATMMSSASTSVAIPSMKAVYAWDFKTPLTRSKAPLICICSKEFTSEINLDEFEDLFRIRIMPNVGHFLMMEDPLAFNRELESVIDELNVE